jgi:hypothetical protein
MSRELRFARTSDEFGASLPGGKPGELRLGARRDYVCRRDNNRSV